MRVLEVFDSLQGEGVWAGTPMTFIRLAGCNAEARGLECIRWCDTTDSWREDQGTEISPDELALLIGLPRVCVTGGEPVLQPDLGVLVRHLHDRKIKVHLETNGTVAMTGPDWPDWVTISPKPPDYDVASGWMGHVDEIKLIVDRKFDVRVIAKVARQHPHATVCLQPEASEGQEGIRRAAELVMANPTCRLSLQIHKILKLP